MANLGKLIKQADAAAESASRLVLRATREIRGELAKVKEANEALTAANAELERANAELTAKVAELEARPQRRKAERKWPLT